MKKLFFFFACIAYTLIGHAQSIVDAAFQLEGNVVCFIKGTNAVQYDIGNKKVIKEQSIYQAFPGLTLERIDAALAFNDSYVCLFNGTKFANYNKLSNTTEGDEGFTTNNSWKGLSFPSYTAALRYPNKSYFFNSNNYTRYDMNTAATDDNYPKQVTNQTWPGLPKQDIQAAFRIGNEAYFFSKTGYIKFDVQKDRSLYTTEHSLSDFPGLKSALNGTDKVIPPGTNQSTGIQFFHGSWDEALAESKRTGKPIFLDAYASWCGPCIYMAKTAFKDPQVGMVYNKKFINVKMDMEKGIGPSLANKYGLTAYPTLYFINSDGSVIKSSVGGQSSSGLIQLANSINTSASNKGIEFFHGSWDEALAESKRTGKPIFLDAYASWCGPCIRMANGPFKDPAVGEYYNKNFVNVKMDMEKGEGPNLAQKYGVTAYPSLFYIRSNGTVIKKTEGGQSSYGLIALGKGAL